MRSNRRSCKQEGSPAIWIAGEQLRCGLWADRRRDRQRCDTISGNVETTELRRSQSQRLWDTAFSEGGP